MLNSEGGGLWPFLDGHSTNPRFHIMWKWLMSFDWTWIWYGCFRGRLWAPKGMVFGARKATFWSRVKLYVGIQYVMDSYSFSGTGDRPEDCFLNRHTKWFGWARGQIEQLLVPSQYSFTQFSELNMQFVSSASVRLDLCSMIDLCWLDNDKWSSWVLLLRTPCW